METMNSDGNASMDPYTEFEDASGYVRPKYSYVGSSTTSP